MRSTRYFKREPIPGEVEPSVNWNKRGNVGLGVFEARDGRLVYFQREFEYHRARQEAVLQCEDDRDSMAKAVARWDAFELEEAIAKAGACAGVVRSRDEWETHEQGKAVAALPLFEVLRIGDSPPMPLSVGATRPLSGVRVLDLTRVLAGPTAAKSLAEHGADVLRVSSSRLPDDPTQAMDTGFGKRAADIDLQTTEGVEQLKELIAAADVFSQAFRPGTLAARGFGPEEVAAMRPGIVYLTLSAFAHEGPWRDRRGFDSIVQNVSGIALENGRDGRPRATPNPLDYCTGYLGAFGVLVALTRRATEGGSYLVRVSLAQTGHWLQTIPRVEQGLYESKPEELPQERIAEITMSERSPFGMLTHLAPVAQLSETPARWEHPCVPVGYNKPEWE
jgi:crotonobetainyl-CoA:carnitine CoA-transferase CaiB-like acyl-CoA transferase